MIKEKKPKKSKVESIRFKPTIQSGLSYGEIQHRKDNKEFNFVKNTTEKTYLEIVLKNVFSFFNILMAAIAIILLSVVRIRSYIKFNIFITCNS